MNPRRAILCAWLYLAGLVGAQTPPGPGTGAEPKLPDLGPPAAVPDGAPPHLAKIERQGLREHAYWLADDARAGRHTTSKGQQATAKYVADHFKKLGLRPLGDQKGYLQQYPVHKTYVDPATSLVFGQAKVDRDYAVLASGETKITAAGKFAWCGNGAPGAVPPGLAGKLPLVILQGMRGGGTGNDLQAVQRYLDIAEQLAKQGATVGIVGLLDDNNSLGNTLNYRGLLPDHARLKYGSGDRRSDIKVPLLVLSAAWTKRLCEYVGLDFAQGEAPKAMGNDKATGKLSLVVKEDAKAVASNVVALLEGTGKKSEAIVFSAHHDHVGRRLDGDVFNGADDNASGTSGLLEIAEAFATGGDRPQRSIVFLSVSGEELGLWGSDWFAGHPTWPLEKIVADVNIDMIGRAGGASGAPIEMQVTPSHQHEKYSTIVRDAVELGKRFSIQFTSGDTYYARSDHYNFAKNGVPVVFFCDGEHPDYHQVTDSPDRLDYVKMEAIARLAFWTGWQVAEARGKPQELGKQERW